MDGTNVATTDGFLMRGTEYGNAKATEKDQRKADICGLPLFINKSGRHSEQRVLS
jgi:hypothetical protein